MLIFPCASPKLRSTFEINKMQKRLCNMLHVPCGSRNRTRTRFSVGTIRFQVLYVFLVLAHDRRRILHFNVTAHPTADWTGQQLREAFPFAQLPRYLLRDRDAIFGGDFREHVRDMDICEVLSAPRSPWQRAYIERV